MTSEYSAAWRRWANGHTQEDRDFLLELTRERIEDTRDDLDEWSKFVLRAAVIRAADWKRISV